jgi:hypothetical protein
MQKLKQIWIYAIWYRPTLTWTCMIQPIFQSLSK